MRNETDADPTHGHYVHVWRGHHHGLSRRPTMRRHDTERTSLGQPVVHFEITGTNPAKLRSYVGGGEGYERRVLFYVSVPDVEAALHIAERLGRARVMGPDGTPGTLLVGQAASLRAIGQDDDSGAEGSRFH
jgi:hypothetical protein